MKKFTFQENTTGVQLVVFWVYTLEEARQQFRSIVLYPDNWKFVREETL